MNERIWLVTVWTDEHLNGMAVEHISPFEDANEARAFALAHHGKVKSIAWIDEPKRCPMPEPVVMPEPVEPVAEPLIPETPAEPVAPETPAEPVAENEAPQE